MRSVMKSLRIGVHCVVGAAAIAVAMPTTLHAGNIVIHIADETNAARMEAASNIRALLETANHTVTITDDYANRQLNQADRDALSQYDLMIFPRFAGGSSTDWDDAHGWPTIDVPMLISSGRIAFEWGLGEWSQYRRNTNLAAPAELRGLDSAHPLLAGVTFDSDGNIAIGADSAATFDEFTPIRSTNSSPAFTQLLTAAYGAALSDDPALTSLAVWEPGSIPTITTRRIFLDLQTEDDLNVGATNNMDVLSDNMKQIYLNAVQYSIPEPASVMLVAAGCAMLITRRRA